LKVNPPILYNCVKELSEKDEGWAQDADNIRFMLLIFSFVQYITTKIW